MNYQQHLPETLCGNYEGLESAQQSSENIVLEANNLSAVNRSDHLKQQRNWKWKLWCFTKGQVLQPISESAESPKDENVLPADGEDEQDPECPGECTTEQCEIDKESNHEADGPCMQERAVGNICVVKEAVITPPKDQYSACCKLIEKFQEAVLDNAVRVIQAAFKRFTQRRRFLRLKKAATVIQRNVRRWLQQRQACEHSANTGESQTVSCQQTCFAKCVICKNLGSGLEVDNSGTTFQADSVSAGKVEDSKSEFIQPDAWDNPISPLENLKLKELDSVSLTDSGIDACSVTSVEAVIEENNPELFKAGIAYGSSEDSISRDIQS